MNKAQELKGRIYAHCPELKELSFGCKFRLKDGVIYDDIWQYDGKKIKRDKNNEFADFGLGEVLFFVESSQIADTGDYSEEHFDVYIDSPMGPFSVDLAEKYSSFIEGSVIDEIETLGHPIHLEHVLRATRECMGIDFGFENGWFVQYLAMQTKKRIEYDLTKSFDQNCEKPELVEFLLEVIK